MEKHNFFIGVPIRALLRAMNRMPEHSPAEYAFLFNLLFYVFCYGHIRLSVLSGCFPSALYRVRY